MIKFCGGIKLNPESLEVKQGIICPVDIDEPVENTTTTCGQLWNGTIFETVKLDGKYNILTSAGVETEIPLTNIIKSNCGVALDGRFFSKDDKDFLSFTERHLLEVLINPPDAEYIIKVTSNEDIISPFENANNIFPLDNIDEQYTVTVNAEGYNEEIQQITANTDHILTITLNPV